MKKLSLLVLLAALAAITSTRAGATAITFDELPPGVWDGLDYADQGVTFESVGAGTELFVRDLFGEIVLSTQPFDIQPIRMIFSSDVGFVQIRNILDGHTFGPEEDIITATAYDIFGAPILTVTQTLDDNDFLTLAVAGIRSVVFDDVPGPWGDGYTIDGVSFSPGTPVPAPAAFLLLAAALSFLGLARKRPTA
jgi:hypothetical protein